MIRNIIKSKTVIVVIAVIAVAAVGFAAGMLTKTSFATNNSSDYIGADKAKQIALENVGVTEKNATFTKVEIDQEKNTPYYELEFYTAACEYEFDIEALTGKIAKKDSRDLQPAAASASEPSGADAADAVSGTDQSGAVQNSGKTGAHHSEYGETRERHHGENNVHDYIGVSHAKEIALHHAGVSAHHATFTDADLDTDDGARIYEIDFVSNGVEYEYDINAKTGAVISYESEALDYDD